MSLSEFQQTDWYKERPDIIRSLIDQFPPGSIVRIKKTNQIAHTYSWFENGTIKVVITAEENPTILNALPGIYAVFGYTPDDLELIFEP